MFSTWARLSFITTGLVLLIVVLTRTSLDLLDRYVAVRTETTTTQVAENIRMVIASHVLALKSLGDVEIYSPSPPSPGGERLATALVKLYPGFYAINWMNADGVIKRVYPVDRNQAALGINLFDHPQVRGPLMMSRDQRTPVLVPRIRTAQGVEGATLYIPVFAKDRQIGWVNAVLDLNGLMNEYLKDRDDDGLSVILQWKSDPNNVYEFGPPLHGEATYGLETQVLNEVVRIDVRLKEVAQWENRRWIGWLLLMTGLFLTGLFVFLLRGLYTSMRDLTQANQRLSLKNALISSLTHDLGNPLTTLAMATERIETERRFDEKVWERFKKATVTLRSMIDSVRFMHAVETGNASLHLSPVSLSKAVAESIELVRSSLESKGIEVVNEVAHLDYQVRADEATLINNVLPNLLSNAIKFSAPGGKIVFRAKRTADETILVVQDNGVGIPKEILNGFFDSGKILSRTGTAGEMGSGLGMLQVKTFMDLYRAQIRIRSKTGDDSTETGTRVSLIFKTAK